VVTVSPEFAERIAAMADLLLSEDDAEAPLSQLAQFALELIPGSAAAGVVVAGEHAWTYSTSDSTIADLHQSQLGSGNGPVAEALRFGEARRIDDTQEDDRWPSVCAAMAADGLRSCLILPLRTDREPGGAIAIYGAEPRAFTGAGHDIALLFAAQGGVAMRNATVYGNCRRMLENLHVALESRAVIEQAKGMLVAEFGYSPEVAFKRLSVVSQNTNRKVKDIAADLVAGRIQRRQFSAE
jgi:GAF domain-containing protein